MEKMETLAFLSAHGKDTVERSDSEYRRERRRMIGSVRFLVMLETWDSEHKCRDKRTDPIYYYRKEGKDKARCKPCADLVLKVRQVSQTMAPREQGPAKNRWKGALREVVV